MIFLDLDGLADLRRGPVNPYHVQAKKFIFECHQPQPHYIIPWNVCFPNGLSDSASEARACILDAVRFSEFLKSVLLAQSLDRYDYVCRTCIIAII